MGYEKCFLSGLSNGNDFYRERVKTMFVDELDANEFFANWVRHTWRTNHSARNPFLERQYAVLSVWALDSRIQPKR